jgi:uncharacterized protein YukE
MPEEKFTRVIAMDFDQVNLAQTTWQKDLEDMELILATANATIQSNLKVTWQGNAAVEFFVAYDPIFQNMLAQINRMKEISADNRLLAVIILCDNAEGFFCTRRPA